VSETFHRLIEAGALAEGKSAGFIIEGWPVLVALHNGEHFAILNRCSHAESKFEGGRLRRGNISCPLHGAPFNLRTGQCMAPGVGYRAIRVFPVRLDDGWISVGVPSEAPGALDVAL
jgi:3-phenylpropionate/trans-cinnamate dioxygenase ferredoxin subunit